MNERKTQKTDQQEILVVDDTPASLKLLTDMLTDQGYRVRPASDGRFALRSVAAEAPDLILLDVKMPDMDGYEVCRRLKSDEQSRKIPVIFISALEKTADKVEGFNAGGIDYITKPFQAEEVLARVRTHLDLRRLQLHLERAYEEMEEMVAERTADLRRTINSMAGRENRMIGLKDAIRKLRAQLEAAGLMPVADDPLLTGYGDTQD